MYPKCFFLFALVFSHLCLVAQIRPAEGSSLHYRIIGFSFPAVAHAEKYKIEVVKGEVKDNSVFEKLEKVVYIESDTNRIIAEVPSFGTDYTWRVVATGRQTKRLEVNKLYHFKTSDCAVLDTTAFRFRVIDSAVAYKDAYIFLDASHVLYDMKGKPVWFVPKKYVSCEKGTTTDIKLSPSGTVTYINDHEGVLQEINYDGQLLWSSGKVTNMAKGDYHHDFSKLKNGNYMCLLADHAYWLLPGKKDSLSVDGRIADSSLYQQIPSSKVVEYDSRGNKVWEWKESVYFEQSDIHNMVNADGIYDVEPHVNSHFLDERRGYLYVNYKNINRVLKVKYPEGNVVAAYGGIYKGEASSLDNGMYCGQHSCKLSDSNEVYLLNNNSCNEGEFPKVILMTQPDSGSNRLIKKWEYQYDKSLVPAEYLEDISFPSGCNVVQLPDRSMFASFNAPYSLVFIVSEQKEILWSALAEFYDKDQLKWRTSKLYRANIIKGKKEMEQFIWAQ